MQVGYLLLYILHAVCQLRDSAKVLSREVGTDSQLPILVQILGLVMPIRSFCSLLFLCVFIPSGMAEDYRDAKALKNAENALNVVYLPNRVTGQWQDRWLQMNIHWPKGLKPEERRPCILFVHGGGYGGGDKDSGFCKQAKEHAIEQGFVVANLNYILGRDIFPQVFHDYDAAVRFLRANAKTYHIDPDRIGTWGFSAGGWLSSSSTFTDAGDWMAGRRRAICEAWSLDDPRRQQHLQRLKNERKKGENVLLVPMDNPQPLYGEYSSRIQALQADFNHFEDNITSAAPAICTYIGKGGVSKLESPAKAAGVNFFPLVLVHPKKKFDGLRAVHVPPLDMMVPTPDGKGQMALQDRVLDWFKEKLVTNPTTPVPEFRPNQRIFAKETTVKVVTTSPDIVVHYTTDGSAPTTKSPIWREPLKIRETTVIKALAVKAGMRPSGIASVRFVRGKVPPNITGPTKTVLTGKVGEPLKIAFTTDSRKPLLRNLAVHYRPENSIRFKGKLKEFSGLSFDTKTGVLSGTPTRAFVYTIQAQAALDTDSPAGVRTYVLNIMK